MATRNKDFPRKDPLVTAPTIKVSSPLAHSAFASDVRAEPLVRYSMQDMLPELEIQTLAATLLLGALALVGQFTIFFAAPNTGKTLLVLYLLIEAIQQKRIDPGRVFYLNMDDNAPGLLEKLRLTIEFGFHMLAEGYQDFSVRAFLDEIEATIQTDQATGVVVILDTYKKFANVMDKAKSSKFNQVLRRFVLKGGTVIALAHTNKKSGLDGMPIYGGTSDVVDDCDCAYTLRSVSSANKAVEKIVVFDNIKRRGNVVQTAKYSYNNEDCISFEQRLVSVKQLNDAHADSLNQPDTVRPDAVVITAIEACIRESINSKMLLAGAAAKQASCSKRNAIQVIEKYTGENQLFHKWNFKIGNRGAQLFHLLDTALPETAGTSQEAQ